MIRTFALVILSAMLSSCGKKEAGDAVPQEEEAVVYAVNAYRISGGNLDEYLEFGGDVASTSSVDVMPDQAGKLTRILVSVGDRVKKDQVIAYVDASRPGMTYKASPVKAPAAGRVISFSPTVGATVSQAMVIARISSTDDLEIKTSVAERFISRVKQGQAASVTFDAYPGEVFTAKVFEVSPVLDTTTRTMAIKLRLSPPDSRVKVGMYARIRLITDSIQNAIVIPASTIVTRDGESYVFKVSGGEGQQSARLQKVSRGMTVDDRCEITSGLSVGELIISKGQSLLDDGSAVNVVSVTGTDSAGQGAVR
ncbi:MAG: efflux RND transporter periplasmic adaptor subunit [Treponema sp.]|nr:efflux RND transporter periplasmic adaptor subunit [Treponema sp.]